MKPALLGLWAAEIAPLVEGLPGARKFTAAQLESWMLDRKVRTFEEMSDLSRPLRAALAERFVVDPLEIVEVSPGEDGALKYVFQLDDGARVEAVDIPEGERTTFCLSSQAGCAQNCSFCVTGVIGPGRNLTAGEIVGQYVAMMRARRHDAGERINVVFMGMGEPTANLPAVHRAFETLRREISYRHITLSTVGNVGGIEEIARWPIRPNLAVSINAADDELRSRLMPINKAYPLSRLRTALLAFPLERGRRITAEYVLIEGVNDSVPQARQLSTLLRAIPLKVNLIPLNEDPVHLPGLHRPAEPVIDEFCRVLTERGMTVTVRRSKGSSAQAACGQLKGRNEPSRKIRGRS